ncbi:hypothetical protein DM01DRAFT_1284553, partial [Hesseltinella vesiculosa]
MSGANWPEWKELANSINANWHDKSSLNAARYLGYPLYSNKSQLNKYMGSILGKIEHHCNILKQRKLSVRGTSLICNSLILSKLWHILRVTPVPSIWIDKIQSVV